MKYQWILFDADETLFSFQSRQGLANVLARYNFTLNDEIYAQFQSVNAPLWGKYQRGEMSIDELAHIRFADFAAKTNVSAHQLNHELQMEMAKLSQPLSGARELLGCLKARNVPIGMITNGFAALQQPRLENTNFTQFVDLLIVSETEGYAKPRRELFERALQKMNNPLPNKVLMVGDTLSSDILGGNNVGMDTCWLNTHGKINDTDIIPTFEVQDLWALARILGLNN